MSIRFLCKDEPNARSSSTLIAAAITSSNTKKNEKKIIIGKWNKIRSKFNYILFAHQI